MFPFLCIGQFNLQLCFLIALCFKSSMSSTSILFNSSPNWSALSLLSFNLPIWELSNCLNLWPLIDTTLAIFVEFAALCFKTSTIYLYTYDCTYNFACFARMVVRVEWSCLRLCWYSNGWSCCCQCSCSFTSVSSVQSSSIFFTVFFLLQILHLTILPKQIYFPTNYLIDAVRYLQHSQ